MHKVLDFLQCSQLYQMHVLTNLILINVINNLICCGGTATNSARRVAHFEEPEKSIHPHQEAACEWGKFIFSALARNLTALDVEANASWS